MWRHAHNWFALGTLLGAITTASLVALLVLLSQSFVPGWARAAVFVGVLFLVVVDTTGLRKVRFPQNGRQVPQSIIHGEAARGALIFGFEMGTGMRTFSPSGLPHLLVAALFLVGSPWTALVAGVGFGGGRALAARAAADSDAWVWGWAGSERAVQGVLLLACLAPVVAQAVRS